MRPAELPTKRSDSVANGGDDDEDELVGDEETLALAGEEHGRDFYAVLTGFRRYSPAELSVLWVEKDRYRPELWLHQWQRSLPGARGA